MRVGIVVDSYKKKFFKKRLKDAGVNFEIAPISIVSCVGFFVETNNPITLQKIIERINAEFAASQSTKQ